MCRIVSEVKRNGIVSEVKRNGFQCQAEELDWRDREAVVNAPDQCDGSIECVMITQKARAHTHTHTHIHIHIDTHTDAHMMSEMAA